MVEAEGALEAQLARAAREARDRDAVAEDVVDPAELSRLGGDVQPRLEEPLVVALARAQQHPVLAEGDRLPVAVGRHVADGANRHGRATPWSGAAVRPAHGQRSWHTGHRGAIDALERGIGLRHLPRAK